MDEDRRLIAWYLGAEHADGLPEACLAELAKLTRERIIRQARSRAKARETAETWPGPWRPPH